MEIPGTEFLMLDWIIPSIRLTTVIFVVETNCVNMQKIKLRQRWSACTQVHTPWSKCPIHYYSQRSLALLIPGSRLNARNSPSACPYCNSQPLKKFRGSNKTTKFYYCDKIFTQIIFNVKFFWCTVYACTIYCNVYSGMCGVQLCVYTSSTFIFPGGIPQAAVLVQINQALFILFTTLSCLGILFAFACLIFNLVFREKQ